jgi:Glutamine amidotransferase domain
VLLEAWRRQGPASLRRLRGMFAIALFDELQCTLTLARDRWVDYVTNPDVPVTVVTTKGQ